eukprot:symbB.v1.2.016978.t1/scaffold1297.1/size126219/2
MISHGVWSLNITFEGRLGPTAIPLTNRATSRDRAFYAGQALIVGRFRPWKRSGLQVDYTFLRRYRIHHDHASFLFGKSKRLADQPYNPHRTEVEALSIDHTFSNTGAMSVLQPESLRPSEEKIDPAERLEKAKKLKEDGNAKFKAEDLPGARKAYAEALRHDVGCCRILAKACAAELGLGLFATGSH